MKRAELDLDAGLWEIPAERMKNDIAHLAPLSRQAVDLFQRAADLVALEMRKLALITSGRDAPEPSTL